jgi:hypothetical protein
MKFTIGEHGWSLSQAEEDGVKTWMTETGLVSNDNIVNLLRTHQNKRYYLPCQTSKCMSRKYLIGLLLGKYFSVKADELSIIPNEKKREINATSELCFDELRRHLDPLTNFGFDHNSLPDKNWLLTILWNVNPAHPVFITNINDDIPHELKGLLHSDIEPSIGYKHNHHPVYKKYLKLKKLKRDIKGRIGDLHGKKYSMKKKRNNCLDDTEI